MPKSSLHALLKASGLAAAGDERKHWGSWSLIFNVTDYVKTNYLPF
jgi:hypothetical protein